MNPLRNSDVYKTFTKQTLSKGIDGNYSIPLKLEPNEKEREKTRINLKQIEQIIHTSKRVTKPQMRSPDYNVNDVDTEKFDLDNIPFTTTPNTARGNEDNMNTLFGHLESDESEQNSITERDSNQNITVNATLNNIESLSTNHSFATTIRSLESIEFDKLIEDTMKRKNVIYKTLTNSITDRFSDVVVF